MNIIKIDDYNEINIEINRSKYVGLVGRNMTYCFKIFYEHFKTGDSYDEFSKYTLLQVNFNNFCNPNKKSINRYYMIDIDDMENKLSNNFSIMNIDIAGCYDLVYNNDNLKEISNLERWAGIIACDSIEDISIILGSYMISMNEKEKFLNDVKEKAKAKDVLEGIKLENTVEERFKWIEDIARSEGYDEGHIKVYEDGVGKGIEQRTIDIIKKMLMHGDSYRYISEITSRSIEKIKEIENEQL